MNIDRNNRYVKLPDFLIVGAAKSGTTSIFNYLIQHPQIFMPALKEPRFFAYCDAPPHTIALAEKTYLIL